MIFLYSDKLLYNVQVKNFSLVIVNYKLYIYLYRHQIYCNKVVDYSILCIKCIKFK